MFKLQNKDSDKFHVKQSETHEQPQNLDHYNLYLPSKEALTRLGWGGSVLSGISEFLAVWFLVDSPFLAVPLGTGAVYLFEVVGMRKLLQTAIRARLKGSFSNMSKVEKVQFVLTVIAFIFLLVPNVGLSLLGNNNAFEGQKNDNLHNHLYLIDSVGNAEIVAINTKFDSLIKAETNRTQSEKDKLNQSSIHTDSVEIARIEQAKKDIKTAYDGIISALTSSKWTENANKDYLNSQISKKQIEKAEKLTALDAELITIKTGKDSTNNAQIANLDQLLATYTENQNKARNGEILAAKQATAKKRKGEKAKGEKSNYWLEFFKNFMHLFLIAFIFITAFSIVFVEVFYKGSDIEINYSDAKDRPNLLYETWAAIRDRFYLSWYLFVLWLRGGVNFDYTKMQANNSEINATELTRRQTQKKLLKIRTKYGEIAATTQENNATDINTPQVGIMSKKRKIGFKTNADATGAKVLECKESTHIEKQNIKDEIATDATLNITEKEKKKILASYVLTTVKSWYKRSDLVRNSESKTAKAKADNKAKYLKAKEDLQQVGMVFIENNDYVTIKTQ